MPNLTLRLPPDLHTELKHASQREHRSLHAEILARLEPAFEQPARKSPSNRAGCSNARNHRPGAFCKTCGEAT